MDFIKSFAAGVWACIPDQEDASWVHRVAGIAGSDKPLGDFGPIIKEMVDKGVSPETIARFAKIIGYETAFSMCYLLEDPQASIDAYSEAEGDIAWGLFRTDPESDAPIEPMGGVHEVLLSMDPSGNEMRPKNS